MTERPISASSSRGAVCSVDERASEAGIAVLQDGGNAVDAAIATNAVLAVTSQHMCGLGGDLFALVHHKDGAPDCLDASGRAGSGADPDRLRAEGHSLMPFREDIRSVPVPGCVDGWTALHERHGQLPFARLLEPAVELAEFGFEVPPHLAGASSRIAGVAGADVFQNLSSGDLLRRPDVARGLRAIATNGRSGWYLGEFGSALIDLGAGEYAAADLERSHADWVEPLGLDAWGHTLWTPPPNSQGYLSLAAAGILQGIDLPVEETAAWVHLHVEAARLAAHDRLDVLSEDADGEALVAAERLARLRSMLDPTRSVDVSGTFGGGGTSYLCTTDASGMGASLMQSNASGFGAHIVVPGTGVFLHNRGIGFNLEAGHPAEYGPGRRPPHTLSPALVTRPDGSLRTVLGTMGGDAQPQIVLQLLSRLLVGGLRPGEVLAGSRWVLQSPESTGFNTWRQPTDAILVVEPEGSHWVDELKELGHRVECRKVNAGHAHLIDVDSTGVQHAAAEPRISTAAALGG